jgi:hypothetical protein
MKSRKISHFFPRLTTQGTRKKKRKRVEFLNTKKKASAKYDRKERIYMLSMCHQQMNSTWTLMFVYFEIGWSLITDVFLAVNIKRRCADEWKCTCKHAHIKRHSMHHVDHVLVTWEENYIYICVCNSPLFPLHLFLSHSHNFFWAKRNVKCARDWTNRARVFLCTNE